MTLANDLAEVERDKRSLKTKNIKSTISRPPISTVAVSQSFGGQVGASGCSLLSNEVLLSRLVDEGSLEALGGSILDLSHVL